MSVTESTAATRDGLVAAALVNQAAALQPLLREHARSAEAARRLPDAVVAALVEAGLFRMLVPRRLGGHETGVRTVLAVTETLGVADGSASWLVAVGAVAQWLAGISSRRAQNELFGAESTALLAGGGAPAIARQVDGGLRVSGRWSYASGAHHADWATLATVVTNDAGEVIDGGTALVPASELTIEDTWHTVGMRGTGSNTWAGRDIFVPDHRTISMSQVAEGTWPRPSDEAMYRLPFAPLATVALIGPLLGLGRAALDLVVEQAPHKGMHHTFFARRSDSVGVQIQIGQAAMALETARLHAYGIADELDATIADHVRRPGGDQLGYLARSRIRARAGYAAQQVLDVLRTVLDVHGAAGFAESSRLQRYWRDANTGARHAALDSYVGYEIYGKALLGLPDRISPMV